MASIEMTDLKGITLKLIFTLIVGTITITGTVMGTYSSLVAVIQNNKVELMSRIEDEKHQREMGELQMKEMRIRLDALEVKVDRMKPQPNQ